MEPTPIVSAKRVPVKEAILPHRIPVVAVNKSRKARLVIIKRHGALGIETINFAITIVIDAVVTLGQFRESRGAVRAGIAKTPGVAA